MKNTRHLSGLGLTTTVIGQKRKPERHVARTGSERSCRYKHTHTETHRTTWRREVRQTERQTDRQTEREMKRVTSSISETERRGQ